MNASRVPYVPPEGALLRALRGAGPLDAEEEVIQVLSHAARFTTDYLTATRRASEQEGVHLMAGRVRAPEGISQAYRAFRADGWMGAAIPVSEGGSGLSFPLQFALTEMWAAGDAAFNQLPALTHGCMAVLRKHAPAWMREQWLPGLVAGDWTGAMGMTEPQAGSDLGLATARAVPRGEYYEIVGQKIFTTWADHDGADNVLHLVLARLPDAPPGAGGLSLFAVPFRRVDAAGRDIGSNAVTVASLESKIGFHASATCVTVFGNDAGEGAHGWLLGEPHRGLAAMFAMLNITRLSTAVQGTALAERAFQQSRQYAVDRVQGKPLTGGTASIPIIGHPDVQRMLMLQCALVGGARALYLFAAAQLDSPDSAEARERLDVLTPVAKAWCSARSVESVLLALQVHGGAGYLAETGIGACLGDALVGPIYEGSNGIQALDFGRRKVHRDSGVVLLSLVGTLREEAVAGLSTDVDFAPAVASLNSACDEFERMTALSNDRWSAALDDAAAAATDFLEMAGTVLAGLLLAREVVRTPPASRARSAATFIFYAAQVLPRCGQYAAAMRGARVVSQAAWLLTDTASH